MRHSIFISAGDDGWRAIAAGQILKSLGKMKTTAFLTVAGISSVISFSRFDLAHISSLRNLAPTWLDDGLRKDGD